MKHSSTFSRTKWRIDIKTPPIWQQIALASTLFLCCIILIPAHLNAQTAFLHIHADTFPPAIAAYQQPIPAPDSTKARQSLVKAWDKLQAQGFILANIDTSYWAKDTLKAYLYIGQQWQWQQLLPDSSTQQAWDALNLKRRLANRSAGKPINPEKMRQALLQALTYFEDHGYPFAKVQWNTQLATPPYLTATLTANPGAFVTFDSLQIKGNAAVNPSFLRNFLGLKEGLPFSQRLLDRATQQLRSLPYITLNEEVKAAFILNKAYPILSLRQAPSSKLNGVVGVLFDPQRQARPVLTGDLSIALSNPFKGGRGISLQYRRLKIASQLFDVSYRQPAILGTRFDVGGEFAYQLEDSTFANLSWGVEVGYRLPRSGRILIDAKVFDRRVDSRIAQNPEAFPNLGSTRYQSYGLGFEWQRLDSPIFPKDGWKVRSIGRIGNKRLRPLLATSSPSYEALYAAVPAQQVQTQWAGLIERFWYLRPPLGLVIRGQGAGLLARWRFQNDLLRVGGLSSLRGFNEQEFFVSNYWITTLEARLHFTAGGYLAIFVDQGYLHRQIQDLPAVTDWPTGVGIELSFRSKAGVFRFAYAAGNSQGQPLDFRTAKIHFGLTSLF